MSTHHWQSSENANAIRVDSLFTSWLCLVSASHYHFIEQWSEKRERSPYPSALTFSFTSWKLLGFKSCGARRTRSFTHGASRVNLSAPKAPLFSSYHLFWKLSHDLCSSCLAGCPALQQPRRQQRCSHPNVQSHCDHSRAAYQDQSRVSRVTSILETINKSTCQVRESGWNSHQ